MPEEILPGDVVVLKCGGPALTVRKVCGEWIEVNWFCGHECRTDQLIVIRFAEVQPATTH